MDRSVVRSEPDLPLEPCARALLVLRAARLAVPVLPPDPAEMLDLEDDHAGDRKEEHVGGHPMRIANEGPHHNGPTGSFSGSQRPSVKRGSRRSTSLSNARS